MGSLSDAYVASGTPAIQDWYSQAYKNMLERLRQQGYGGVGQSSFAGIQMQDLEKKRGGMLGELGSHGALLEAQYQREKEAADLAWQRQQELTQQAWDRQMQLYQQQQDDRNKQLYGQSAQDVQAQINQPFHWSGLMPTTPMQGGLTDIISSGSSGYPGGTQDIAGYSNAPEDGSPPRQSPPRSSRQRSKYV